MLDDILFFVQTCQYSSFNDAAGQLGMSLATLSRRINRLEQRFGISLFYRERSGLRLTRDGQGFYQSCQNPVAQLNEVIDSFEQQIGSEKGHIKFVGPANFIKKVFSANRLDSFFERYPQIIVDFELSNERINLNNHSFDLALRIGELEDSRFICKTISYLDFVLVAAPALLRRFEPPKNVAQLVDIPQIVFSPIAKWQFNQVGQAPIEFVPQGHFIANDMDICIARGLAGHGMLYLPKIYVSDALAQGKLVRLLENEQPLRRPVQLLWPNKLVSNRTRLLIDYLAEVM